jgi:hypothetical protein
MYKRLDIYDEVHVATLNEGATFGELALLDSASRTTATIRCL